MKSVWEELESLDQLPTLNTTGEDVTRFLEAFEKQKEKKRLFQLLNGLDETYGALEKSNTYDNTTTYSGFCMQLSLTRRIPEDYPKSHEISYGILCNV